MCRIWSKILKKEESVLKIILNQTFFIFCYTILILMVNSNNKKKNCWNVSFNINLFIHSSEDGKPSYYAVGVYRAMDMIDINNLAAVKVCFSGTVTLFID